MTRFSYTQALLALAISFLAYSLIKIANEIPNIVAVIDKTAVTVDKISPQIPDMIILVDKINQQIPAIIEEVAQIRQMLNERVPSIVNQVDLLRPVVSEVVKESEHYSTQLPLLFSHLTLIEQQIAQIEQTLPSILKRIDAVVTTTNKTVDEVALWRPHSTEYLKQIENSRTDIPQYLASADVLIRDAKTIGQDASSGLFMGLIKGAVRLPFDVISGVTGIVDKNSKSAKNFTAQDIAILQESTVTLLDNNHSNKRVWQNSKSGNRGVILKESAAKNNGQQCHLLVFTNYFKKDKEILKELMCLDDEGIWQVI